MLISSHVLNLRRALTTSATASSYTTRLATTTKPVSSATRCVIPVETAACTKAENAICVFPWGGNDNNDQIAVKGIGWSSTPAGANGLKLWVPTPLCDVLATLSSTTIGVADTDATASALFADTLSITYGTVILNQLTADVDYASFLLPCSGFELVELQFKTATGGDAANGLWRFE